MRAWIAGAVLLGLCPVVGAHAGVHVGAGWARPIDGESAVVGTASWLSEQRHPWEVMAGYISEREEHHRTSSLLLALSRRATWRRWFVQGGLVWVSQDNEVLSGHAQFMTALGADFGRPTLSLRHVSNGSTNGRNRGETLLLFEIGF